MFAAKLLSVLYGNYTTSQALSNLIQSKIRKIDMRRKNFDKECALPRSAEHYALRVSYPKIFGLCYSFLLCIYLRQRYIVRSILSLKMI